jgi:hypothetical protein
MERSRVESLTKELYLLREELKTTAQSNDRKDKKLTELEAALALANQNAQRSSELLSKASDECKHLQYQLTDKSAQLDSLTKEHKESALKGVSLANELNSLQSENEYCKSLTADLQETYRLNERYLNQIQQLKADLDALGSQAAVFESQIEILTRELANKENMIRSVTTEKREFVHKHDQASHELLQREAELRGERERIIHLESALTEHRNLTTSLQRELENHRNLSQQEDLKWNRNENALKNQKNDIDRVCGLLFQATVRWDNLLVHTLDMFELTTAESRYEPVMPPQRGRDLSLTMFLTGQHDRNSSPALDTSAEQLLPSSLTLIERIQGKLERVERIRGLFEKKTKELVASVTQRVTRADDRIEILSHKLSSLQLQLQSVLSQVLKDKRTRDQSYQELKELQESILKGHAEQLREHETRSTEVHLLYQTEKNKVTSLSREVSVLTEEINLQREELDRFHEAEQMLNKLSNQFTALSDSNRQMAQETDDKSRQLAVQSENLTRLSSECDGLQASLARATSQIEVRDKMLAEQEALLSGLKVEIQQLQQRQIHPELERSLRESQDLLKSSIVSRGGSIVMTNPEPHPAASNRMDGDLNQLVERLAGLCQLTRQLVDETTHICQAFDEKRHLLELGLRGEVPLSHSSSRSTELEQSLFDLLNSNAKLSLQVQALATEFKRTVSPLHVNSSAGQAALIRQPPSSYLSTAPRTPHLSATRGDFNKFSSTDLRIESHPASPLHHSAPSTETPQRVQFQFPESQQRLSKPYDYSRTVESSRGIFGTQGDRGRPAVRGTGGASIAPPTPVVDPSPGDTWSQRSQLLFDSPGSLSSSTPLPNHRSSLATPSRHTVHLFGGGAERLSSPTPARESASRLSKLGQDLQSLATRLDSFDSKSKK